MKIYKILLLVTICSIGILAWNQNSTSYMDPQEEKKRIVEIVKAKLGTIRNKADFIGTIASGQRSILSAKAGGALKIMAKPGENIKKGTVIAEIENADLERNYKIAEESEKIARVQFERAASLSQSGISSKNASEEKKSQLLDAQKRLSDAKSAMEDGKISAPFDGTISLFKFKDGAQIDSGDVVVNFYVPTALIAEFDVPLDIAKQIKNGATVFVDNKEYSLTHIEKILDEETHMCPAYVDIDCADCIIGSNLDVSLVVEEKHDVVIIPFEAIFLRDSVPHLYIAKDGKAILTDVKIGLRDKASVEIISGLKGSDEIILSGQESIYPGAEIEPMLKSAE